MGDDQRLLPGLPDDVAMDCLARVPYRHHYQLRRVCRGWRNFAGNPSFYGQRLKSSATEALVCLIQTLNPPLKDEEDKTANEKIPSASPSCGYGLSIYNATVDEWRRLWLPQPVPLFAQCAAVQASGKIIILGGYDPNSFNSVSEVFVIDLVAGSSRRGPPMDPPRSFFACAVLGPLVYVAGGHDNQKNALRTAQVYDTEADEWQELPPMEDERDECQGLEMGGEFCVISGYGTDNQGRFSGSVECYDPEKRRWRKEESLWAEADELAPAAPPRASCFVRQGGQKLCHVHCIEGKREVREFEGVERRWKVVGETPGNLRSIPCVAPVADGNGRLLAVGCDGESRYGAWMMDTASRRWSMVDTPPGFAGFAFSASSINI